MPLVNVPLANLPAVNVPEVKIPAAKVPAANTPAAAAARTEFAAFVAMFATADGLAFWVRIRPDRTTIASLHGVVVRREGAKRCPVFSLRIVGPFR
ncbi:MAG: hypothetical protein AB8H80_07405 [Planctomycetota bacterium]